MKIIIVGCGKVGKNIAVGLLQEGHDIVLIDKNAKVVEEVSNALDLLGVIGDGASYQTLMDADIKNADVLLAVTNSDELNLLCCLFAKKLGNVKTIARVRNHVYYEEINHIRDELGLEMIINPEITAAKEISTILKFPSAIKVDRFNKGRLDLLGFTVKENSNLVNKKIMDVIPKLNSQVLVAGIERNEEAIIPNGNTEILAGDKMTIVIAPSDTSDFFNKIGVETGKVKSAMIIGGSNIAYYLAKMLLASGIKVTILEAKESRCEELSELLPEATILNGDGTDEDVLKEEGIEQVEAVASLTGLDEENILVSLYASTYTNAKVITKLDHVSYDKLINKLELGSIVSPKELTAQQIIRFIRSMDNSSDNEIENLYKILSGKAEALSFRIKKESNVTNKALAGMKLKDNLLIGAIIRNGKSFAPTGKDEIKVGDSVIVVTTHLGLNDISDILA